ncbi:hypothetical protein HC928_23930 [bacterium]|nr:hypothetical protein [bacterium]
MQPNQLMPRDIVVGAGNSINNGVVVNNFYSRRNIIIALLIPIPLIFPILILRYFLGIIHPPFERDLNLPPSPNIIPDSQLGSDWTHDRDGAGVSIDITSEFQLGDRNPKSTEELIYQIFAGFRFPDVPSDVNTHTDDEAIQSAKSRKEPSDRTKDRGHITPMQWHLLIFLGFGKISSRENTEARLFKSGVELPKLLEEELPLFPISDFDFEQAVAISTNLFEYSTEEISSDRINSSDPSGDFTKGISVNHMSNLNSDLDDEIVPIKVFPITYLDIITSQDRLSGTAENLTEEEMTEILLSELREYLGDPFPNTDFINFNSRQYAKNGLKPASEPHYLNLTGLTPIFLVAALKKKQKPKQKS